MRRASTSLRALITFRTSAFNMLMAQRHSFDEIILKPNTYLFLHFPLSNTWSHEKTHLMPLLNITLPQSFLTMPLEHIPFGVYIFYEMNEKYERREIAGCFTLFSVFISLVDFVEPTSILRIHCRPGPQFWFIREFLELLYKWVLPSAINQNWQEWWHTDKYSYR